MPNSDNLQELLDRLRQPSSQDAARDALMERSLETVRLHAERMFHNQRDLHALDGPDDVVSKAMLRLRRAITEVKPTTVRAFFALATKHIRWVLNDLAREKNRGLPVVYLSEPPDPLATCEEPSYVAQWSEFHAWIEEMPEEDRELFDLLFYQGLEQTDAAAILGLSLRTLERR